MTWSALEQALNKREMENKGSVTNEAHHTSAERPDTAPLPSSPRDVTVEQEPPKTAMSPNEFTKVRN